MLTKETSPLKNLATHIGVGHEFYQTEPQDEDVNDDEEVLRNQNCGQLEVREFTTYHTFRKSEISNSKGN